MGTGAEDIIQDFPIGGRIMASILVCCGYRMVFDVARGFGRAKEYGGGCVDYIVKEKRAYLSRAVLE